MRENSYAHQPKLRVEQPTLLASKYDNLFKEIISAQWNVKSDGEVESPTGFFALVEIPSHEGEFNEMVEAVSSSFVNHQCDAYPESWWPAAGWYITTENGLGQIFAYECVGKGQADRVYQDLCNAYNNWSTEGDDH